MPPDLRAVAAGGFAKPEGPARPVLEEAVLALASPDPVLRDEVGFGLIEQWIGLGAVPVEEAAWLVDAIGNESVLCAGIGGADDDSVFGRSFAVLALGICIYRDNREPFLERERWDALVDMVGDYARNEVDLRGYVDGKGWAHAAAHTADLIGRLAQSRFADAATGERILEVVGAFQRNATHALAWGEDERLARALALAVEHEVVTRAALAEWAAAEVEAAPQLEWSPFDTAAFARRDNLRRLLRALYFRLPDAEDLRGQQAKLADV